MMMVVNFIQKLKKTKKKQELKWDLNKPLNKNRWRQEDLEETEGIWELKNIVEKQKPIWTTDI